MWPGRFALLLQGKQVESACVTNRVCCCKLISDKHDVSAHSRTTFYQDWFSGKKHSFCDLRKDKQSCSVCSEHDSFHSHSVYLFPLCIPIVYRGETEQSVNQYLLQRNIIAVLSVQRCLNIPREGLCTQNHIGYNSVLCRPINCFLLHNKLLQIRESDIVGLQSQVLL